MSTFTYTGKTFTIEERKDRAAKALKLNDNDRVANLESRLFKILDTGTGTGKPTILIKRITKKNPIIRLKGASAIQDKLKRERERAEKALKLNL